MHITHNFVGHVILMWHQMTHYRCGDVASVMSIIILSVCRSTRPPQQELLVTLGDVSLVIFVAAVRIVALMRCSATPLATLPISHHYSSVQLVSNCLVTVGTDDVIIVACDLLFLLGNYCPICYECYSDNDYDSKVSMLPRLFRWLCKLYCILIGYITDGSVWEVWPLGTCPLWTHDWWRVWGT